MLPKHNAEGPAGAAAEVQVDQAGQGGRDVGTVVSRDCRKYRVRQCLDFFTADSEANVGQKFSCTEIQTLSNLGFSTGCGGE